MDAPRNAYRVVDTSSSSAWDSGGDNDIVEFFGGRSRVLEMFVLLRTVRDA